MRRDFLQRLASGEVLVAWGPIHTLLGQERGRSLEGDLAEWIVDHPDEFQSVLKATYAAGSDIGTTGTQGSGRYRLRAFGLEDRVYELTLKPTQLAREVTPENCYLHGIVGVSGRFLEPVGDMTVGECYENYKEQIVPLLDGGVGIIRCDDNDIEQTVIAIRAARDHCDLPVMGSCGFYPTKRGLRSMMGDDVKTTAARLQEAGADVIGATCGGIGMPIEHALTAVKEMRLGCNKPLAVVPCAGLAQLINGKLVWPVPPEQMAKEVPGWIAAGASIVGGCCGSSLKHIEAISAVAKGKK